MGRQLKSIHDNPAAAKPNRRKSGISGCRKQTKTCADKSNVQSTASANTSNTLKFKNKSDTDKTNIKLNNKMVAKEPETYELRTGFLTTMLEILKKLYHKRAALKTEQTNVEGRLYMKNKKVN